MIKNNSKTLFTKIINTFSILLILIIVIFSNTPNVFSLPNNSSPSSSNPEIIEHLKLNVPSAQKEEWIYSEKQSWEPWLNEKKGFLGRQLFWDKEKQEATLLISWASRSDWKSIPNEEIDLIQERFEEIARLQTGIKEGNPFPLVYEGELIPQ